MEIFELCFDHIPLESIEEVVKDIASSTQSISLTNCCVEEGEPSHEIQEDLKKCSLDTFLQDQNSVCFELLCRDFNLYGRQLETIRVHVNSVEKEYLYCCIWYDYVDISLSEMQLFHKFALSLGDKHKIPIHNIEAEDSLLPDLVFKGNDFYVDYL